MDRDMVRAGIHPTVEGIIENDFSKAERQIARFWSNEWYITSAGKRTTPGRSDFKFW